MNIILLSGGSGKRLWPLSNDIRSKQFIKMFDDGTGDYESMVQRVYRQIKTADSDAHITIATSKKQVSAIHNQLGNQVDVCVEPARRDTFAAIALACAFLTDEKHLGPEESVLICPVDPYVEQDYFAALQSLEALVKTGNYPLNLMGVEPSYPSEKYGYILPQGTESIAAVKAFKEKPDKATAQQYITQGALWNCGVFAFKLDYLMKIAHENFDFSSFTELQEKYETLPKISFDYAVVEKESSIGVLRFTGHWKDIGTWNTFAEEMNTPVIGKAVLDDTCQSVNVLNELNIPVLCMGCRNMIVAASGDGILISDKEQSSYIKPYVDKIESPVMFAEKSWGSYAVLDVQPDSMTIRVLLQAGRGMYYHSHEHRDEVWTVLSGTGTATLDGMKHTVKAGDVLRMPKGCKHTIIAQSDLQLIEVQLGKEISVHDKIKYNM